jgi:hypothetical protein
LRDRVDVSLQKKQAAAAPVAKSTPEKSKKRALDAVDKGSASDSATESDDASKGKKTPVKKKVTTATPSSSKSNKTPQKTETADVKPDGWGADLGALCVHLPFIDALAC